ncbi:MAG: signal peptidase II [Planctomycetota bacterium]
MRWFIFFLIAIVGTIGDLITKELTSTITTKEIIPGVLQFKPVLNKGIIWGLFQQGSILFLVIPALAVPLIVLMFKYIHLFGGEKAQDDASGKQPARLYLLLTIAFGLILAGALGNLYDRIAYKAVRDFIDFYVINWPVFNLADTYITIGAGLIIVSLFIKPKQAIQATACPPATEQCPPSGEAKNE